MREASFKYNPCRASRMEYLYQGIERSMRQGGVPEVTFDVIDETFGGALHHHPMYFPLSGMPSPGNAMKDFEQWLGVQGWEALQDLQEPTRLKIFKKGATR